MMLGTREEKLFKRVKRMLALADTSMNSSEEEAKVAMLKAQTILAAQGWNIEDIVTPIDTKRVVEHQGVTDHKQDPWWVRSLAVVIAPNFRVHIITRRYCLQNRTKVCLIGLERDVEVCREVVTFAIQTCANQANRYMRSWKKEHPYASSTYYTATKNDYIWGSLTVSKELSSGRSRRMPLCLRKTPWWSSTLRA